MNFYNQYFDGVFWLPQNEGKEITATLFIDDKGIATISSLQSLETSNSEITEWPTIELVLGYLSNHDDSKTYSIKLHNTYKSFQSQGPLNKFKYTSKETLIAPIFDRHIQNDSYNILMLNSGLIDSWVPITGFDFKSNSDKAFEISHLYNQPEKIELYKNNDFDIYLFFRASTRFQKRRKSLINETIFINVETTKEFQFQEFPKIKKSIERLFNLILFKPFLSTTIELKSTDKINYKVVKKSKELNSGLGKAIDFEVFRKNSSQIFENWFEKQNKLELAIINFFSVFGQNGVLLENKFITYISILENYHKNHIKKKGYLKSRLEYLINKSSVGLKLNSANAYAEKLKITRNYHAHLEEKHKERSLEINEILKANYLLEFMIHEIFLIEIGINENILIPYNVNKYIDELNN
jgi:hypothetical protein